MAREYVLKLNVHSFLFEIVFIIFSRKEYSMFFETCILCIYSQDCSVSEIGFFFLDHFKIKNARNYPNASLLICSPL